MERYQGEALPWLIAGGINLDILARPSAAFRFRDSNPGIITERPGGVGFNMARNLTGIGSRVLFLTVLGDDRAGTVLAGRAAEAGVDLSAAIIKEGERSSR